MVSVALKRAALVLGSAALTVALIEGASSAALHFVRAKAVPPADLDPGLRLRAGTPADPDPWLIRRVRANVRTKAVQTNEQGLRNGPIAELPGADTLRVLLLGGSTAWGYTSASNDDTIAAHLERWLAARAAESPALGGRRVEVLNGAVPGYVTWQGALAYTIDRRRLRPHVVITLDGANDVHATIRHHQAGGPLSSRADTGMGAAPKSLGAALRAWWGYRAGRLKVVKLAKSLDPVTLEEHGVPPAEEVARAYRAALELLADSARAEGALAVATLQPMSILEGTKPLTPFEAEIARVHDVDMPGRNAYYEACFAAFRAVHAELGAQREDLLCVDLTRAFADMTELAFVDHCHLTTAGRLRLVEVLGEALLRRLE